MTRFQSAAPEADAQSRTERTFGFLLHFAKAYPGRTLAAVLLLVLAGLAEGVGLVTLLPLLNIAVRGASGAHAKHTVLGIALPSSVAALLGIIVVALLLKSAFRWLAMKQVGYTLAHVGKDLRVQLLRALMNARWIYYSGQPSGLFANAVSTEAYRAATAYKHSCAAIANVMQVLVYGLVIVTISWRAAVFAIVVGALAALALGRFIRLSRRAGQEQTAVTKSLVAGLADALQGVKPIKAMAGEAQFLTILEEEAEALERAEQRQVVAQESLMSFHEPIIALMLALGIYGALHWGSLNVSSLLVIAFLFYRLTGRFQEVQREYQAATIGESFFWSLYALLTEAEGQQEHDSGTQSISVLRDCVALDHVSFSYDETPILRDVSLTIPVGTFAAIVGPSGAGKTTIVDLIVGLHVPAAGAVLLDGRPLTDLQLRSWRRMVGYVPQETLLLHDTVYTNVALANVDSTRDEVAAALKAAGAWDFVSRLEHGMDTVIGERGLKLSGGQRQRIAIARALVRQPALLILDEATTALDPETEAAICDTLRKLAGRVTIVAVSHQSAIRKVADMVYEFRDGRLTACELDDPARRVAVGR